MASGLTPTARLQQSGIDAKRRDITVAAVDDIWIPPVGHALWHPRGADPIDETLVLDIMSKLEDGGITEPITVRDDGIVDGKRRLLLVNGARRTVNGREAQRRLREAGKLAPTASLYVKLRFWKGSDGALILERVRLNAEDPLQKPDSMSVLSATFRQSRGLGSTDEEILRVAPRCVGKRELEALMDWENLVPEAAAKFDSGEAPIGLLRTVLDAPREEQSETLDKLIAAGATSGAGATRALRREKNKSEKKPVQRPHPKTMTKIVESLATVRGAAAAGFALALRWQLGENVEAELPVEVLTVVANVRDAAGKKGKKSSDVEAEEITHVDIVESEAA